jgi:hypothetical protein
MRSPLFAPISAFGFSLACAGAADAALVKPATVKPAIVALTQESPATTPSVKTFSWDDLAEPGRSAADTERRLKNDEPDPSFDPGPHGGPATPHAVTLTTPGWSIPPGAQGYNVTFAAGETGVMVNGVPKADQMAILLPAGYNPLNPPPLVIAWHGYGTSHNQPMVTGIPLEANNRGWMVMSPLGIADNTFGWIPGQISTEYMLEWLLANYPFDVNRIYGVGFSMGADCILTYAARHQDPSKLRIAALATVCGTYDNVDNYVQSPATQTLMQTLFGGPPFSAPFTFEYERVSMIRLTMPLMFPYPPVEGESMARGIAHLPMYMTWSTDDNVVFYAPTHNQSLLTYLTSLGNAVTSVPVSGQPNKHHWSILNIASCFNWFSTKTLDAFPDSFTILADRNGTFNSVKVLGGTPGQFKRFDLASVGSNGVLSLLNTDNIDALNVDISNLGFGALANVQLTSSTLDATGDTVLVRNSTNPNPPSKVRIDSVDDYGWGFSVADSGTTIHLATGIHSTAIYYDTFDMTMGVTGTPAIGNSVTLDLTGGADGEAYAMLYAASPGLLALSFVGDGDPRWLLLDPLSLTSLWGGTLSGGGQDHLPIVIPNDAGLVGLTFPIQSLTVPGSSASIPFVIGRISNVLALTIQ